MGRLYWTIFDAINYQTLVMQIFRDVHPDQAHRDALRALRLPPIRASVLDGFMFKQMPLKKNFQRAVYTRVLSMRQVHMEVREYFENRDGPARRNAIHNLLFAGHFLEAAEKIYCDHFVKGPPILTPRSLSPIVNKHSDSVIVDTASTAIANSSTNPVVSAAPPTVPQETIVETSASNAITEACSAPIKARSVSPIVNKRSNLFTPDSMSPELRAEDMSLPARAPLHTRESTIPPPCESTQVVQCNSPSGQREAQSPSRQDDGDVVLPMLDLGECAVVKAEVPQPYNHNFGDLLNQVAAGTKLLFDSLEVPVQTKKRASTTAISIPKKKKKRPSLPRSQDVVTSNLTTWVQSVLPPLETEQTLSEVHSPILGAQPTSIPDVTQQTVTSEDIVEVELEERLNSESGSEYLLSDRESDDEPLEWNEAEMEELELSMLSEKSLRNPPVKHLPDESVEEDLAECSFCGEFYSRVKGGAIKQHILYWCSKNPNRRDIDKLIKQRRGYRLARKLAKTREDKRMGKGRRNKRKSTSVPLGELSPARQESIAYLLDHNPSPAMTSPTPNTRKTAKQIEAPTDESITVVEETESQEKVVMVEIRQTDQSEDASTSNQTENATISQGIEHTSASDQTQSTRTTQGPVPATSSHEERAGFPAAQEVLASSNDTREPPKAEFKLSYDIRVPENVRQTINFKRLTINQMELLDMYATASGVTDLEKIDMFNEDLQGFQGQDDMEEPRHVCLLADRLPDTTATSEGVDGEGHPDTKIIIDVITHYLDLFEDQGSLSLIFNPTVLGTIMEKARSGDDVANIARKYVRLFCRENKLRVWRFISLNAGMDILRRYRELTD